MPIHGHIQFRPGGPGGARFPAGEAFGLTVVGIESSGVRRPGLGSAWSINPALHVIAIRTPTGLLDMAAQPDAIPKIIYALGYASSPSA